MTPKNSCQSCMMPLSKDPEHGGTNADGSKSTEYCSYCYKDGQFINPNITMEEMKNISVDMMKQNMGIPKFIGRFMMSGMKNLKRWKTA